VSAPPFQEIFGRLVGFDTVSRLSNLAAVDYLANILEDNGLRVERDVSANGEKANLLARLGPDQGGDSGAGLTLSGHLDVVPAEEADWSSDPFTLTDRGERWVARGSADMKGFLALATELVSSTDPARLSAPLALLFTYDEEVGSRGAEHYVAHRDDFPPLPRPVVIGEPTRLRAIRLHKGHARMRITITGQAAHSGHPQEGRSAIEPAAPILVALTELRRELERERPAYAEHFPEVPYVALNIARIRGGDAINVVPDRCVIDVGVRPLPGMNVPTLVTRVRDTVRKAAAEAPITFETLHESPAMLLDEDVPLYRFLCTLTGQSETVSASFSSDAGFLARAGHDCVLFGPGDIQVAHRANEFLPKDDIARARDVLRGLIARMAG
jgi:acetylornithine deacetylase